MCHALNVLAHGMVCRPVVTKARMRGIIVCVHLGAAPRVALGKVLKAGGGGFGDWP